MVVDALLRQAMADAATAVCAINWRSCVPGDAENVQRLDVAMCSISRSRIEALDVVSKPVVLHVETASSLVGIDSVEALEALVL